MQSDTDQPLSLQDEINLSELQQEPLTDDQIIQPDDEQNNLSNHRGTSNIRQIFDKIFALLQSTHVNESVT